MLGDLEIRLGRALRAVQELQVALGALGASQSGSVTLGGTTSAGCPRIARW
jgi:hypothetical protein